MGKGSRKAAAAVPRRTAACDTQAIYTRAQSMAVLTELLKEGASDDAQEDGAAGNRTTLLLQQLGIGGLDSQVRTLLRRALASRLMPPGMAEKLGVKHVRGLLLYGPPGTGKTLVARQLGKLLNAREPKLISGPELLSMWVGKSEENIRNVFEDAEREWKEKGEASSLHLVIFDEIDALTRKRGSMRDSSGVMDSCVNQLLAKIDGLLANDNMLVIGTTNRRDLLDDALLRPGRLEVHMEMGLPDLRGREQIFRVHTAGFDEHGALAGDVEYAELARRTQNFTGAEIEGVVKSGLSFALQRQISVGPGQALVLSMLDLLKGIKEAKPHYGVDGERNAFAQYMPMGFNPFCSQVEGLVSQAVATLSKAKEGKLQMPVVGLLIRGAAGAGKTALLAKLASMSGMFAFRRLLRSHDLLGLDDAAACDAMVQLFQDAHQCPHSLLLLDDLEALIQHCPACGGRFSSPRLHTLLSLLGKHPPKARVCCIIATTALSHDTLSALGLQGRFAETFDAPLVEEATHVSALIHRAKAPADVQHQVREELKVHGKLSVRRVLHMAALS